MRNIWIKEVRLCASPLSFVFILFGLMFFLPGYPVLCGAFFVTLGLYQSFLNAREANDLVFSALLPVKKRDTVKGKFLFVCAVELSGALLMVLAVLMRMFLLTNAAPYRNNALMNANPFALGMAFIVFGLFNTVFVGGFFKTGYKLGKPFLLYCLAAFFTIGLAEALHHFPGLEALNAFGTERLPLQLLLLLAGMLVYAGLTVVSLKKACERFERTDL